MRGRSERPTTFAAAQVTDRVLAWYLELAQEACVDFGLFCYYQGRGVPP